MTDLVLYRNLLALTPSKRIVATFVFNKKKSPKNHTENITNQNLVLAGYDLT